MAVSRNGPDAARAPSRRTRLDRDRSIFTRGTVNGVDRGHVAPSFHAVRLRVAPLPDALRKGIELQSKFVYHFELLLEPPPLNLAEQPALFFESERRIQRRPAFVAVHLQEGGSCRAVTGSSQAYQAVGVNETKSDVILYLAEAFWVVCPGVRRSLNRSGASHPAHGVDAINAQVHQRTAASQLPVQLPSPGLGGIDDLGVGRVHVPEAAQLTTGNQLLKGHTSRLKVLAISNHQANPVCFARLHHTAAISDRVGHRLFAQHVLPCRGSANRLFSMRTVNRRDENRIDTWMAKAPLVVFVAVAVFHTKLRAELLSPFLIMAHQSHQLGLLAVSEGRQNGNL